MLDQHEHQPIRYDEKEWRPRPTLSGDDYTSQQIWDEEKERIWWGDWVCIGREEEVANPGDYLVRDLAGESIFITRDHDGGLNGFYNVCSHRGRSSSTTSRVPGPCARRSPARTTAGPTT